MVKVKPGRARNHLVPYKMAAYATEERLAEAALKRASWAGDEEAMDADEDHVKKVRAEANPSRNVHLWILGSDHSASDQALVDSQPRS